MKNIIRLFVVCLILSLAVNIARAKVLPGRYALTLEVKYIINNGNHMKRMDFEAYTKETSASTTPKYILKWVAPSIDNGHYAANPPNNPSTGYYAISERPSQIYFFTRRVWRAFPWGENTSTSTKIFNISADSPDIVNQHFSGGDIFLQCTADVTATLQPDFINFFDAGEVAINSTLSLPDNNYITLRATSGFPSNTYQWQYSTSNNADVNNDALWQDFPSNVQNNRESLTFRGRDIFTPEVFRSLVESNTLVYVRIKTSTKEDRNRVVLQPIPSAPHISVQVVELETCNGDNNAQVKISFDRELLPGDNLTVKINNDVQESAAATITLSDINPVDNSIIIRNVPSASGVTQTVGITGTYKKGDVGYPMYNAGPLHSVPITVSPRPKVNHSISRVNVNCYDGSDGQVIVKATGGTGTYTAILTKVGDAGYAPRDIPLIENESSVFGGLTLGTYKVDVSDSNGCRSADINVTIDVTQPNRAVEAQVISMIQPLANDSQDGSITIRIDGGTQIVNNGYLTMFNLEGGASFSPTTIFRDIDGSYLHTFTGLGKGDYFVTIQDNNYANLTTENRVTPCTCEAILRFTLPAPPPIIIEIEETHFVNWYDGDQGELTANAQGGVPLTSGNLPYIYTWYKRSDLGVMQEYPVVPANSDIATNLKAGVYQVKVTDKNGISKTSASYTLTQPDPVKIQFSTVQTGCYGSSSGKITAFVSGGVPDYKYQWNIEGVTGNEASSLEAGTYILKVTDSRGGYLSSPVEVKSSSTLKVDSLVRQPTCVIPGAIELQLSGATPPYLIAWDDSPTTSLARNDLMPGVYRVVVTDANNCANSYRFTLKEPRGFTVSLGGDLVMCHNQMRAVEVASKEPNLTYKWYFNNVELPGTDNQVIIDQAGIYKVTATNQQGCVASDQISVKFTQETLELNMTAPTTIEVGSQVHAINLSTMSADRIEWELPEGATIISQSDTELIFTFNQKGTYKISMEGFKGEGSTIVIREITVVGKGEVALPDSDNPLIKQFWVTPNPSTGYFKVVVELNQPEDFTMTLYSPAGLLMDTKEAKGVQTQVFEYEINGSLQGTYLLHLSTKTDKSVLQIVIKKD